MVRSGLKTPPRPAGMDSNEEFVGVPRVSHYRLASHLSTAAILYALFLWSGFSHLFKHPKVRRYFGLYLISINPSCLLTFAFMICLSFKDSRM